MTFNLLGCGRLSIARLRPQVESSSHPDRWHNGAEAEACDDGQVGVRTKQCAEHIAACGRIIAQAEDEKAGLDLLGEHQVEAAGLLPKRELSRSYALRCGTGQLVLENN